MSNDLEKGPQRNKVRDLSPSKLQKQKDSLSDLVRESQVNEKTESEKIRNSPKKDDESDMFETNRSKDQRLANTLQPGKNRDNDVEQAKNLTEYYKKKKQENDTENNQSVDALIKSIEGDDRKEHLNKFNKWLVEIQ